MHTQNRKMKKSSENQADASTKLATPMTVEQLLERSLLKRSSLINNPINAGAARATPKNRYVTVLEVMIPSPKLTLCDLHQPLSSTTMEDKDVVVCFQWTIRRRQLSLRHTALFHSS